MIISKPPIKYTEMAIYVDEHAYTDGCDYEKVFACLYYLALMLAYKNKLFRRQEYYEDFALMFAEDMFLRLRNPKQYMLKEDGTPRMPRLTSILNYMKKALYGRKVAFEQGHYSQSFSLNQKLDVDMISSHCNIINQMRHYRQDFNEVELETCLSDICKTIKGFLKDIPYSNNKKEWENIYISCLLTISNFLSSQERSNESMEVILYHLDESMRDYIDVLCKRIEINLSENFYFDSYENYVDEKDLIKTTLNEMGNNNILESWEP